MDNTNIFSGKAGFYECRPTYPKECIEYLLKKFGITQNSTVADIGAGTGILTRPFLDYGCSVYAVEPNKDMFSRLEKNLFGYPNASLLNTTAEETGIPDCACDAIFVGTAFHWFDKDRFRDECLRMLRGNKYIAILRISNNTEGDKKLAKIRHTSEQDIREAKDFFENGFIEHKQFEFFETFDEKRYIYNLLSSATAPLLDDSGFESYVQKCKAVYRKNFGNAPARLPFAVDCFIGQLII